VDPLAAVEDYYAGLVGQQDRLALPLVGGPASDDPQVARLKAETFSALEELLTLSQEAGVLRCDVTVLDLVAAGAMACRPLPNLPADQAAALAARNVRVFVDGLCTPSPQALPPLAP
jgi:hypothetical protein